MHAFRRITTLFTALLLTFLPLRAVAVEETRGTVLDTRVSFEVSEADVGGVLKTLAEAFDLNIVVGEGITGEVTLSLTDVRLEDALDLILETAGYYYTFKNNIILVQAPEKELATEIVVLGYATASEVQGSIEALLSEQGSIEAVDEQRLVIKELPKRMQTILKEIAKLDHPPRQIMIEARIVEVEDTDLTAFGIQWSGNMNLAGYPRTHGKPSLSTGRVIDTPGFDTNATTGAIIPSTTSGTVTDDAADFRLALAETSADITGGQFVYGLTYGRVQLSNIVDALVRTNRAHILASPTIAAMDGEEAKIIIGEKFPFRENTLTAVGTTETTKFVDIGTALRVTPRVINEEDIMIEIHPEVSSLNESLSAGPRINTREASTKLIVQNGQTIVIAGLIQHDKTVIRQKVPFFGNLPILGLAFRNRSTDFVTKELVVFVTPYLMKRLVGEEGKPVLDLFSGQRFYNRAVRLMEEFGVESLGKTKAQRLSEAIANFKTVVRNFGDSEIADDALYQLGRIYGEMMDKPDLAAEAWNELVTKYPDSPYADKKLYSRLKKAQAKADKQVKKRRQRFKS